MTEKEMKKVIPIIIEGLQINAQNVTFHKLQEFSLTLYEKLLDQRRERSFLILERDKLRTILDNIRHEINLSNAILTNKNDEMKEVQERYNEDIKETKQEVKFIDYDHNVGLSELEKWGKDLMLKQSKEHFEEELGLLNEKKQLKVNLAQQNLKCEEDLRNIKTKNNKELEKLQEMHKELRFNKEQEYENNLKSTIEQLTLKHKMEMFELEERKNTHLTQLKAINKNRVDEIKRFFNSTTAEHLTVISDLKQNLDKLNKNKGIMSSEEKFLKAENKKFQELLDKTTLQVNILKRQLINYEKDLINLKNNKSLLHRTEIKMNNLKSHSTLTLRKIKENNNLDSLKISKSLISVTSIRNIDVRKRNQLEKLISVLIEEVSNKRKLIKDLTCDSDVKKAVSELKFEYWNPRKLSYELAVMCKAHDDLLKTLWGKLQEFCVPEYNLSNTLLDINNIGKGAVPSFQNSE